MIIEKSESSSSRKVGLSCAECRRSKLKCDRRFPCQSCIRRGCASICPEGILPATKGNKVLMAHAQELSRQVKTLTARIRELEQALEKTQGETRNGAGESGSLMDRLRASTPSDVNNQQSEEQSEDGDRGVSHLTQVIGSLSIGQDGQMRYRGTTAGAEYLQDLLPSTLDESKYRLEDHNFPSAIRELVLAFPFGMKDAANRKAFFFDYLPPRERALQLTNTYYEYCSWMYDPIGRSMFIRTFLDPIYGVTGVPSVDSVHSHKLSVFFLILANGALYDETLHDYAKLAAQYHLLGRAALSLDSMLTDATVATCEALFMIIRFIYNSDRSTNEERWLITGLCARVAQMIGLQRDSGGYMLPDDEVQRRRSIFWDLWTWDSWTAVVNGRPGALSLRHTECALPSDLSAFVNERGEVEPGYHIHRSQYCKTCIAASSDHVFAIKTPPYHSLLALDKMIRNYSIPSHLRVPAKDPGRGYGWASDSTLACQQMCAMTLKETNLLYIHRSYFAQAIRQSPDDPFKHKYAPSVYAVITSAKTICINLHGLYERHPKITRHAWYFWTSMYSACIVLAALVVECPGFSLSPGAYMELKRSAMLYEEGSQPCRSGASLRHIQHLVRRATQSLEAYRQGLSEIRPSSDPSEPDALDVLGGRKTLIISKSNSNSPESSSDLSACNASGLPANRGPMNAAEMFFEWCQSQNPEFRSNNYPMYNDFPSQWQQPQGPPQVVPYQGAQQDYASPSYMSSPTSPPVQASSPYDGMVAPQAGSNFYPQSYDIPMAYRSQAMDGQQARSPNQMWPQQGVQYQGQQPLAYARNSPAAGYGTDMQMSAQPDQQYNAMSQYDIWSNFAQDFA